MKTSQLDIAFTIVLLALGAGIVVQAIGYGVFGPNITGSGFFPLLAGGAILLCCIAILLDGKTRQEMAGEVLNWHELKPVCCIVAATIAFIVLVPLAGMVLLTFPYVAAIAYSIHVPANRRGHAMLWLLALCTTVALFLLFDQALNVPLPWGVWGS